MVNGPLQMAEVWRLGECAVDRLVDPERRVSRRVYKKSAERRHPDGRDPLRYGVGAPYIPHVHYDRPDIVLDSGHRRIADAPSWTVAARPAVPSPVAVPGVRDVNIGVADANSS